MNSAKFLFIHIPKTGGTSVERALSLGTLGRWLPDLTEADINQYLLPGPGKVHQHAKLIDLLSSDLELPSIRFSVVRNPWAQVVSEIAYFRKRHTHFVGLSWKESIRKLVKEPAFIWGHDFKPQISWLLNDKGEPDVDFVARTEFLDNHFQLITQRLQLNCPPLTREISSGNKVPDYADIYDDESKEWVRQKYAVDIEVFGYQFPEPGGLRVVDHGLLQRDVLVQRFRQWRDQIGLSVLSFRTLVSRRPQGDQVPPASAADKYTGKKEWGWYLKDLEQWHRLLHSNQKVKALEIGGFDGISSNMMLDCLFTHPESEVYVIDPFEPDPSTPSVDDGTRAQFLENAQRGGHGNRLKLYEGLSVEVLAWMLSNDGYWETFDFIYVHGSHTGRDVLTDAVMSWNLLKPGGILAFDDYEWQNAKDPLNRPKAGIDAFHSVFAPQLVLLVGGWRRIWQKTGPCPEPKL